MRALAAVMAALLLACPVYASGRSPSPATAAALVLALDAALAPRDADIDRGVAMLRADATNEAALADAVALDLLTVASAAAIASLDAVAPQPCLVDWWALARAHYWLVGDSVARWRAGSPDRGAEISAALATGVEMAALRMAGPCGATAPASRGPHRTEGPAA